MREREGNLCFQTMRVRMKSKNAFSAFLDVTIVFYALFYLRIIFLDVSTQGVRSQWCERGKFVVSDYEGANEA